MARPAVGEWVSVEDRRPKRGELVVWYHPPIVKERVSASLPEYIRIDRFDLASRPASHWMPLPKNPTAVRSE